MVAERSALTFDISEYFFRLATESLRRFSNETQRFALLSELVERRATLVADNLGRHDVATLKGHLQSIPSNGSIALDLELSTAARAALLRAGCALSDLLGATSSTADILSILLFDYLVERRTAEMMRRIGGERDRDQKVSEAEAASWLTNVLPFR